MFVLSKDGRMIHGPITDDVVYDQTYVSDIIESHDVIIAVKCKKENFNEFSIHVKGVCQGIPKPVESRGLEGAEDCNFDVNCPQGVGWESERDAVALVLINGTNYCSGSLVNDECQDLRPFFLTAYHCLDLDRNDSLSNAEKDLSLYAFKFKYESDTPTCPGNSSGTQGTWIVFSGAAFRAANNDTDFALAELNGSIANQSRIALAGWDRRNITPLATTLIHHPAGDVKKITFDFELAQQTTIDGRLCWWLQVDEGATIGGSSGAPYFDQNNRIVGQHFDTGNKDLPVCEREDKYGGRFDLSWTGGGSDDTRLSNWLGGANPPTTTNTIRPPTINAITVTPSNNEFLVCITNKQFGLSYTFPDSTVHWSVSNPGLFSTTGGAATSGTGVIATLRADNSASSGSSILTFIITQSGCADIIITKQLWVGVPDFGLNYTDNICIGTQEIASLDLYGPYGLSLGTISWSFSGSVTGVGSTAIARYRGIRTGWGNICLTATNGCGTTTKCFWVYVDDCMYFQNGTSKMDIDLKNTIDKIQLSLSPNPVKDILSVCTLCVEKDVESILTIRNINGLLVQSEVLLQNKVNIDMTGYIPGVYFVQYKNRHQIITQKIIKL